MARTIRPAEERIAEIDSAISSCNQKIIYYTTKIQSLELKKERIKNPVPRKRPSTLTSLIKKVKESGMSVDEMAQKLGITL